MHVYRMRIGDHYCPPQHRRFTPREGSAERSCKTLHQLCSRVLDDQLDVDSMDKRGTQSTSKTRSKHEAKQKTKSDEIRTLQLSNIFEHTQGKSRKLKKCRVRILARSWVQKYTQMAPAIDPKTLKHINKQINNQNEI